MTFNEKLVWVGLTLITFAVVSAQAIIILHFHLPAALATGIYLGILAMDVIALMLAYLWWTRRQ